MEDTNKSIEMDYPVLCLRGASLFPNNDMTIEAGRSFSKAAVRLSMDFYTSHIIVVPQLDVNNDSITLSNLSSIGTIATVKNVRQGDNNIDKIYLVGISRVKISSIYFKDDSYFASFSLVEDEEVTLAQEDAYINQINKFLQSNSIKNSVPKYIYDKLVKNTQASEIIDSIAQILIKDNKFQTKLLCELNVENRLELMIEYFNHEKEANKIENEINKKVQEKLDTNQREYILREKLKAIKEELGDFSHEDKTVEEQIQYVKDSPFPEYVKTKALAELKRLENMPTASSEYSMLQGYTEWLLSLPWFTSTEDNNDINEVEKILNEDHYGLEKIKERIIEYLAVKAVTNSLKSPIICFAGPPGVGKTSLAKSIARALNRKFVKMALGGLKDESEIRGHRRTYLGALPGRILQNLKRAGVNNPVFLLDEIDKMGSDYKGDPTSAMLEILDPEQNKIFLDNYIEEPFDLSNVLFICTANYLENIPAPLIDRMEIINISSYTEIEKLNIALKHLVAKQLINHGIENEDIKFSEEAIMYIIRYYTREAGVRDLERLIAKICRKLVVRKLKNENQVLDIKEIKVKEVKEFLGNEIYDFSKKEVKDQVGVVTGLAYTQYGGDILPVEVNSFKGNGQLILTGKLGEVMKESASIALDYVKANADKYFIDKDIFDRINIHIHVPEGAVPKDGPSAGITLTTAIVSLLTNRTCKKDIAMTGEVTLRGNVLPIGGLKEKSISAHRSGIKTVIIPKENEKDLEELPKIVLDEIKFIPVSQVDEVIKVALNESTIS